MTARFLPGSLRRLFCSWSSRVRRSVILIILYEVKWSLMVNHRIRTDLIGCSPLLWVSVAVLQHHTVYYSVSVICEPQHTIYIKKKKNTENHRSGMLYNATILRFQFNDNLHSSPPIHAQKWYVCFVFVQEKKSFK